MRRTYVYSALIVGLLALAWALNVVHQPAAQKVADRLGCRQTSSSHPHSGESRVICLYHGDRVVIWSLGTGPHSIYPPAWVENVVMPPAGQQWVIGCSSTDDCRTIRQVLGGDLNPGPVMGISIVVR